jgi:carbon-monoxide dehydrogenase large subunit
MATGAAAGATEIVKERILGVAGAMLGCDPDTLRLEHGAVVSPAGDSLPLAAIGFVAYTAPFTMPPGVETDLRATFTFDYEGGWAQACHCCLVEVDPETGRVEILRYVVAENCGRPIHPGIVDGQIVGGITQGVGAVLYESAAYGEDGQFLAGTLREYLLPTAMEAPKVEIHHIVPDGDDVPSHGVGEGGNIGAPAAVTNAIEDALRPLGVKVREQHLPPPRLLGLIGAARDSA